MLVWEAIIETSDTALVAAEWAMYEIAKDPKGQVVSISNKFVAIILCLIVFVLFSFVRIPLN